MGKIKGWRKQGHLRNWESITGKYLMVRKTVNNEWTCELLNDKNKRVFRKVFRLQTQALDYAYVYMRANPNG